MKMLNCLVVDDEPPAIEILRNYVSNTPGLTIAGECHHAVAAFDFLQKHPVDLIFLDVNMPKISGTDFLKALKNPPKVIFTTAYREFAVDGYELGAVDYLLKPFSLDRFWKAIQRVGFSDTAIEPVTHQSGVATDRFLYVRSDRKMVKIFLGDILFVESLKDYLKIVLNDRQVITKQTITSIEEMLPERDFIRIHRSFVIAAAKVNSYSQGSVFIGGNELPIGPLYRQQFMKNIKS